MGKSLWNTVNSATPEISITIPYASPLFIRLAVSASATTSKEIASLVDVAPTLLAIAGGKAPPSWQGRALIDQRGQISSTRKKDMCLPNLVMRIVAPLNALIGTE